MLFIYRTSDTDQKLFGELPLLNDTVDFMPQWSFEKISTHVCRIIALSVTVVCGFI